MSKLIAEYDELAVQLYYAVDELPCRGRIERRMAALMSQIIVHPDLFDPIASA